MAAALVADAVCYDHRGFIFVCGRGPRSWDVVITLVGVCDLRRQTDVLASVRLPHLAQVSSNLEVGLTTLTGA